MWPFGTDSISLIRIDDCMPINFFKEVLGLKIFSWTTLVGRLWGGSRDDIASNFELFHFKFSSEQ